jgi:hypothetical protein
MCESLPLFSTFQLPLILKSKQIFTGILHDILSPGNNKKIIGFFLHTATLSRVRQASAGVVGKNPRKQAQSTVM